MVGALCNLTFSTGMMFYFLVIFLRSNYTAQVNIENNLGGKLIEKCLIAFFKMPKRKCKFSESLRAEYSVFKSVEECDSDVYCPGCKSKFSIANKGRADLNQHLSTKKHKDCIQQATVSKKVDSFFTSTFTKLSEKISATEATLAFHTIKHHFSYKSTDCTTKLLKKILPDSEICKRISSARTKTEAIINGVLAPHCLETVTEDLNNINFVGISTDASNHGSIKLFPVMVHYFDRNTGISQKVIELTALKNEKAESISTLLIEVMDNFSIKSKCIAFSGDNCNTNFGGVNRAGQKNVFSNLKTNVNTSLVGIGCPAHVVNNCIQFGMDSLPIDIESLVMKIYGHFSVYTLRIESLKTFCNLVDSEYRQLYSHTKTRWLSLYPCLNSILHSFEALKAYFLSAEVTVPFVIRRFFEKDFNESYIWFSHSLAYLFYEKVKSIEAEKNSILEISGHVSALMASLVERKNCAFLPFKVKDIFKKAISEGYENEVNIIKSNFIHTYDRCIQYLALWTDQFKQFNCFQWMKLDYIPKWDDIELSILFLKDKNIEINENKCFDEFCNLKSFVTNYMESDEFSKLLSHERWINYFKSLTEEDCNSEFFKICSYFFAIPAHNANLERVFSLVNSQWTDERNKFLIESIKCLIITLYNFKSYSCSEFYDYVLTQKEVLLKIQKSEKYEKKPELNK